jgi:hypothetical protein
LGIDRKIFDFRYALLCFRCGAIASIKILKNPKRSHCIDTVLTRSSNIGLGDWGCPPKNKTDQRKSIVINSIAGTEQAIVFLGKTFVLDFRLKRRKERQEVNVTNCQKSNDQ